MNTQRDLNYEPEKYVEAIAFLLRNIVQIYNKPEPFSNQKKFGFECFGGAGGS